MGGWSRGLPRPPCTTWEGGGSSRARGAVVGVAARWVWGAKANLFMILFHRTIQMVMVLVAIVTFIDIDRGHHGGGVEAREHHRLGRHGLRCSRLIIIVLGNLVISEPADRFRRRPVILKKP